MIRIYDARSGEHEEFFKILSFRGAQAPEKIDAAIDEIISGVRERGDEALFEYTKLFDGAELTAETVRVTDDEIGAAFDSADARLLDVIRKAAGNIEAFHLKQKEKSWFSAEDDGVLLGQLYRPLASVGVYVPGGTAAYPSSVLMNVIPAKVAGVKNIIMATPPGRNGVINPAILAAAKIAGADTILKIGGAQAVAALAFGTESVPRVDKITGPGNIYVASAKRKVFGFCDIDMIAGPSEITIVADEGADPSFVAADMLSQAEHDALASAVLVTPSEKLAGLVAEELEGQLAKLGRREIAAASTDMFGAIIITGSIEEAMAMASRIAPEHLELCVRDPFELLGMVENAGAVFLGHYSPEPVGDYFAGPNHVLPTNGTARFFSPLNVADFMKKTSVISYTRKALEKVKDDIILFAEAEGLEAHANSIRVRFEAAGGAGNGG